MRLARHGTKKKPFYRIVVTDSRSPRDGSFLEVVGTYNPTTEPPKVEFKRERVQDWLANGAAPTDTVRQLLKKAGISKERAA